MAFRRSGGWRCGRAPSTLDNPARGWSETLLNNIKKFLSLLILLLGLGILVRTVLMIGLFSFSGGMVAGIAFTVYGAARLYSFRGTS